MHCAGGSGRICSLAQSRGAGLKHCGFFCRRAVCTMGIPQYWELKNPVIFVKDSGSTKDLFTPSMKGEKRGNSSDCRDEILQLI